MDCLGKPCFSALIAISLRLGDWLVGWSRTGKVCCFVEVDNALEADHAGERHTRRHALEEGVLAIF